MSEDILPSGLAKIDYPEIQGQLRTGDILFYSGEDELSQLIRWATKSFWSHVGIIINWQEYQIPMLLESLESSGVHLMPLPKYIKGIEEDEKAEDFYGRLIIGRHQDLDEEKAKQAAHFGLRQIGRPYDHAEIRRIMQRIAAGEGKQHRDRAYMCSELVYECFMAVGIDIPYNQLGYISPEDIWQCTRIEAVAEINHL